MHGGHSQWRRPTQSNNTLEAQDDELLWTRSMGCMNHTLFWCFCEKGPPFPSEKAFVLFHPKRRKTKLSSALTCASSKEADSIANARAWHLRRAGATRHSLDQPASPLRLERLCSGASMHMDVSLACTSLCVCFISSASTRSLSRS